MPFRGMVFAGWREIRTSDSDQSEEETHSEEMPDVCISFHLGFKVKAS